MYLYRYHHFCKQWTLLLQAYATHQCSNNNRSSSRSAHNGVYDIVWSIEMYQHWLRARRPIVTTLSLELSKMLHFEWEEVQSSVLCLPAVFLSEYSPSHYIEGSLCAGEVKLEKRRNIASVLMQYSYGCVYMIYIIMKMYSATTLRLFLHLNFMQLHRNYEEIRNPLILYYKDAVISSKKTCQV